jgi:hypothetical protein
MAFITPSPLSPEKGTPLAVSVKLASTGGNDSLQETLLAAYATGQEYFTDNTNAWNKVHILLKSDVGGQQKWMIFDASSDPASGSLSLSSEARDVFEVQKVIIYDFDGGKIELNRSQLNPADFDFDLSSPPPPPAGGYPYTDNFLDGSFGTYQFATNNGVSITPSWGAINLVAGASQTTSYELLTHLSPAGAITPTGFLNVSINVINVNINGSFILNVYDQSDILLITSSIGVFGTGLMTSGNVSIAGPSVGRIELIKANTPWESIDVTIDSVTVTLV